MAPVFDSFVFDSGVFETEGGGFAATMTGTGSMSGSLQPFIILMAATMAATGSLSGALATAILMAATMQAHGELSGDLRVARFAGRLSNCGDPLSTACQEGWMPGT